MMDTATERHAGRELGVVGAMWHHRWMVAIVLTLSLAAGVGLTLLQPEQYGASAQVQMSDPREAGVFRTEAAGDDVRRQQNRVERFLSPPVLARAAALAGTSMQLGELRSAVEVVPASTADRITVTAWSPDPALARDLANAIVVAYREQFRAEALADAERTVAVLDAELVELEARLEEVEAELARYVPIEPVATAGDEPAAPAEAAEVPPSAGHITLFTTRRESLVTTIRDILVARERTLIEARAAEDVAQVEEASMPSSPGVDPLMTISLTLVVGLAAGALLSVWRSERPRRPGPPSVAPPSGSSGPAVTRTTTRAAAPQRIVVGPPRYRQPS